MGIVNLKVTLGTVNYTDWIHVTAAKVSSPNIIVWEDWIDVPITNYNFVIPNLDPENYYVSYRDAATNTALGTLQSQLVVNALSGDTIMERRFYTCGGGRPIDPANNTAIIVDPYLIGKNISGIFKETFRFYEPGIEYTTDPETGTIAIINGVTFNTGEKISVEIKYKVASTGNASGGLYTGTLDVTEQTKTLLATDADKRIRLVGSTPTQVVNLCALAGIAIDRGFYFDNSCGGTAVQVKLLVNGADRIRYNGFMLASDLFAEFWVSKGEHLLIRKYSDAYWEVLTDYAGVEVGSRQAANYRLKAGWHPEDGTLADGDEYCRVWWYINFVLPSNQLVKSNSVTDPFFTHPADRPGQFAIHTTLKKFRWPNTQNLSERGLADFNNFGSDAVNRPVDAPGGFQDEMVGPHKHNFNPGDQQFKSDNANDRDVMVPGNTPMQTDSNTGTEQRVKNIGVIYAVHI